MVVIQKALFSSSLDSMRAFTVCFTNINRSKLKLDKKTGEINGGQVHNLLKTIRQGLNDKI